MKENSFGRERDEIKELISQYNNFRKGTQSHFIEEESFERIIDYFDENDQLPQALEAAEHGILQYPYSSILLIKKADLLISAQKFQEALSILEKASVLDNSDINLYILKVDAYMALRNPEKANDLLIESCSLFEKEEKVELLFELSNVFDDYEDFDKVFYCLKLVLEEDPANEEALYKICFWTDFTGKFEESIVLHNKVIDQTPYSHLAWFNLGTAYQGLKLYEKAIDAYQYAIAIDEKFDYAYRNLGDSFIRIKNYTDAIEALEKVLELSLPEEVIYEALGHCYDKLHNLSQSRVHYRKAVHLKPEDSHLYFKIAGTYMKEAHWQNAINQLTNALSLAPSNPDYHFAIAICFAETGHVKEAVIHFSQYIKSRPKSMKGWKALIQCLYAEDYLEEALEQVNNALIKTNGKTVFIYYKAAIYLALGKSKEGMLHLHTALLEAPKLLKDFVSLDPSNLQNAAVARAINAYKEPPRQKRNK